MNERHLEERLAIAAPGAFRLVRRVLFTLLQPGSTLRRRLLKHFVVLGWEAFARGDADASLMTHYDGFEFNLFGDMFDGIDFRARYVGRADFDEFLRTWWAAWSSIEIEVDRLYDLGDLLVVRFRATTRGAASGAEVSLTSGASYVLRQGSVTRQDFYWYWADCATALGLADDT